MTADTSRDTRTKTMAQCSLACLAYIALLTGTSTQVSALNWMQESCQIQYCGKIALTNKLIDCPEKDESRYFIIVQRASCSFFEDRTVPLLLGNVNAHVDCEPSILPEPTCEVAEPSAVLSIAVDPREMRPGTYETSIDLLLNQTFGGESWPLTGQIIIGTEAAENEAGSLFITDASGPSQGSRFEISIPSQSSRPEVMLTSRRNFDSLTLEWEFELTGYPWSELTLEEIRRLDREETVTFNSLGDQQYRLRMPGYWPLWGEQRFAVELRLRELPEPVDLQLVLRSPLSLNVWIVLTLALSVSVKISFEIKKRRERRPIEHQPSYQPQPFRTSVAPIEHSRPLKHKDQTDGLAPTDEAPDPVEFQPASSEESAPGPLPSSAISESSQPETHLQLSGRSSAASIGDTSLSPDGEANFHEQPRAGSTSAPPECEMPVETPTRFLTGSQPVNPTVLNVDLAGAVAPGESRKLRRQVPAGQRSLLQVLFKPSAGRSVQLWGDARPRVNFIFMIDTSGSMAGQPIEAVSTALEFFINDLEEDDILGIGTYDDTAREAFLPQQTKDCRKAIDEAVAAIAAGGGTRLEEGLRVGIDMVKKRREEADLSRLFLLSDGGGASDPVRQQLAEAKRKGIQVSTLGFGPGVNDRLLREIAQTTGGRYEFVERPEKIVKVIEAELGALRSTAVSEMKLCLKTVESIRHFRLGDFTGSGGESISAALGDLEAGAELQLLIELDLCPLKVGVHSVGELQLGFVSLCDSEMDQSEDRLLRWEFQAEAVPNAGLRSTTEANLLIEIALLEADRHHQAILERSSGRTDAALIDLERLRHELLELTETHGGVLGAAVERKASQLHEQAQAMRQVDEGALSASEYQKRCKHWLAALSKKRHPTR